MGGFESSASIKHYNLYCLLVGLIPYCAGRRACINRPLVKKPKNITFVLPREYYSKKRKQWPEDSRPPVGITVTPGSWLLISHHLRSLFFPVSGLLSCRNAPTSTYPSSVSLSLVLFPRMILRKDFLEKAILAVSVLKE